MKLHDTFHVKKVEKAQIDVTSRGRTYQFRPYVFYIKEDGAIDGGPSFAIVGENLIGDKCVMQISADMFRVAYEELKQIYEPTTDS